ncbi:MAG TPA: hypothetical protein VFW62_01545 [bacterium]|nr:hypothetical protein [bacterium]
MSEPAKTEDNDFKKFGDNFEKKFSDLSETIENRTQALERKIDSVATRKETPPKKEDDDDDLDDDFFGENEKLEKKLDKKVDEKIGKLKEEQKNQNAYDRECSKWDGLAYEEFPMKRADFKKDVETEIAKNMAPLGKDAEGNLLYPPDAVYNAAARVYARKVKAGQIKTEDPELEDLDGGGGGPRSRVKGKDIGETQLEIGRRLGLSEEQTRNAYKNHQERKRR